MERARLRWWHLYRVMGLPAGIEFISKRDRAGNG